MHYGEGALETFIASMGYQTAHVQSQMARILSAGWSQHLTTFKRRPKGATAFIACFTRRIWTLEVVILKTISLSRRFWSERVGMGKSQQA